MPVLWGEMKQNIKKKQKAFASTETGRVVKKGPQQSGLKTITHGEGLNAIGEKRLPYGRTSWALRKKSKGLQEL